MGGVLFNKSQTILILYPRGKARAYTIPASVTSIGESAFGSSGLTSITIPDSVTSIGHSAFLGSRLGSITIPDSVTSIGASAFRGSGLTSVTIPDGVTSIGEEAFSLCQSLTSVIIGNGVTSIGEKAFRECKYLISVTIVNGVTSIPNRAFSSCNRLTSVTMPASVTSIGLYAFGLCHNLTIVYFEGNAPVPTEDNQPFLASLNVEVFYRAGTTGWGALYSDRPTRLTSGELDPLMGGLNLDEKEGWFGSGWFGSYNTEFAPWLFHINHGFIYRDSESSNASIFFYDVAMGAWWWTDWEIYPWIYAFDPPADDKGTDIDSEWLHYALGTNDPRSFGVGRSVHAETTLYYDP